MTKVMFIDHREKSGLEELVRKYLDKNNLFHQTRENLITDYAFSSVGIEAKSIHDYMQSLQSGHLQRQLQNLDEFYKKQTRSGILENVLYRRESKRESSNSNFRRIPPSAN